MEASPAPSPASDERLWAALAHGSVILSFFGPLAPVLIWVFQRRKSPYAAFHALQAMGYQMLTFWVGMTAYLLFIIVMIFVMFPVLAAVARGSDSFMEMFAFEGSFVLSLFGFLAIYFLVGIVGAILSLMGRDFKIPLLGTRLARYLGCGESPAGPLNEAKAEQWVAGVCHGSAILFLFGMFTPLVVWLAEKDRAPRLGFQSLQAFVYQMLAMVGYFAVNFLYFISFIGFFLLILLSPSLMQEETSPVLLVLMLFLGIVILLLMAFLMLGLPTYHLFAMIAGIQIVKGKDYRYPLLGNFLARRFGGDAKGQGT